jgi:hypothetical protein
MCECLAETVAAADQIEHEECDKQTESDDVTETRYSSDTDVPDTTSGNWHGVTLASCF